MSAVAKFYMAERVRELLENWGRWPGWQSGGSSRSTLAWLDDFVSNKRVGDYSTTVPVMGGDAADTHRALGRMPEHLAGVLVAHYTWHGAVLDKLIKLNKRRPARGRISKRTYYRQVEAAHPIFMEAFRTVREAARAAHVSNVAVSVHAGAAVASRHRFPVTPKMGLQPAKKVKQNQEEK